MIAEYGYDEHSARKRSLRDDPARAGVKRPDSQAGPLRPAGSGHDGGWQSNQRESVVRAVLAGARTGCATTREVRDAVRAHLPQVVAAPTCDPWHVHGCATRADARTLPLSAARTRSMEGVGMAPRNPVTGSRHPATRTRHSPGTGGDEDGGSSTPRVPVDDIVDCCGTRCNCEPRDPHRPARDDEWTREGWDRRGAARGSTAAARSRSR